MSLSQNGKKQNEKEESSIKVCVRVKPQLGRFMAEEVVSFPQVSG
jgi:hypothetical protein